jgi:hypothetical protein
MSKISCFTKKVVALTQNAVGGQGEVAAPEGGGGFADYAVVSLHYLRVYLEKSYRVSLDLLSKMPNVLREIGRVEADLPDHSMLVKAFDRIKTAVWRVLLRLSACTNQRFVRTQNRAAILGRSYTSPLITPPLIRRFSTATTRANTTATGRIIVFRPSKQPLSWTRNPRNPRRSLYDDKPSRHTARLAGRPSERGRPTQPRRRQGLRLDGTMRKFTRRGRETTDQTSRVPAHRSRARSATPCARERGTASSGNSF